VARLVVLDEPRFAVPEAFGAVVAQAFSQRRKTLRNSLRGLVASSAWDTCGIDAGARPEELHPHQFATLAALTSQRADGG
jgi:16S rRNA (adenine1518-N6/adenine1519-N6)-dimethyltransferase